MSPHSKKIESRIRKIFLISRFFDILINAHIYEKFPYLYGDYLLKNKEYIPNQDSNFYCADTSLSDNL